MIDKIGYHGIKNLWNILKKLKNIEILYLYGIIYKFTYIVEL